jgi:hypothetical protein
VRHRPASPHRPDPAMTPYRVRPAFIAIPDAPALRCAPIEHFWREQLLEHRLLPLIQRFAEMLVSSGLFGGLLSVTK